MNNPEYLEKEPPDNVPFQQTIQEFLMIVFLLNHLDG